MLLKTKGNKDWLRSWQHCRRVYPEMPTTVPLALPSFVSLTHPTVQLLHESQNWCCKWVQSKNCNVSAWEVNGGRGRSGPGLLQKTLLIGFE